MTDTTVAPLISARGIDKTFATVHVLHDVDLDLLPGEMRDFVKDGTVSAFQLWSPYNEGWLAAHFAKGVIEGTIKNEVGATFEVPTLGTITITITINENNAMNTQAELTTFTAGNIDDFDF